MIRIVTDTSSDITRAEANAMNVELVSLPIHFAEFDYDPEQDQDFSQFYSLLKKAKNSPTTSQPPPKAFEQLFQDAKDAGDSVVAILLSGALSGTFQSAVAAKETVGHPDVYLIDSRTAAMSLRMLVDEAVRLRNEGSSAAEIAREAQALCPRLRLWAQLDTLSYLYKGGRLSKTSALAGNLLGIKPIVTAEKGLVALSGRARNYMGIIQKFIETGFDSAYPVYFAYTPPDDTARKLMQKTIEQCNLAAATMFPLGSLIGAHVGPGCCGLAYVLPLK